MPPNYYTRKSKANTALISVGSAVGGMILLFVVLMSAKAISKRINGYGRSFATRLLDSMEEEQLFDIREGKKEEVVEMAQLA